MGRPVRHSLGVLEEGGTLLCVRVCLIRGALGGASFLRLDQSPEYFI